MEKEIVMGFKYYESQLGESGIIMTRKGWGDKDFIVIPESQVAREIGEAVFYEDAFLRNAVANGAVVYIKIMPYENAAH